MDWISPVPAAFKLGLVLLTVVFLMRARVPMGASLLAGSGLLALFFSMPLGGFFRALGAGLSSDETVFFLIVVAGILVFSGALNSTGQIKRIIESFKAMMGESRLALVAFPALIGLLPMPGGAIFSAPMVEAATENFDIDPARSTIANYWFRHIWEFWLPLYPGVILALTLTRVPTGRFILMQLPMTLWAVATGYVAILHRIRLGRQRQRNWSRSNIARFVRELTPILIVVGAVAFLDPIGERAARILRTESLLVRRMPLLLGLALAAGWLFAWRGLAWGDFARLFLKKSLFDMVFLAAGTLMFKSVLERCGAVEALREEFTVWNIPLAALVGLLPFVAGLVVGLAIGFVGASFPFVIAVLSVIPQTERLPYYFLAYGCGFAGMMLSPVHLCLLLTNQYFQSRLPRVYAYLLPLGLLSAAFSTLLFFVYRAI